jgi:hypothetical protein
MVFSQARLNDIKAYLQHPEIQKMIKNIKEKDDDENKQ